MELRDGSHVSSENGSLKITGRSYVGGICGFLQYIAHISPKVKYCPVYANIISTGGNAGGIIGNMEIWDDGIYEKVFETHYPVRVSITVDGGDNAGGAIGYLTYKSSKKVPVISGFNDNLQASITTKGNIAGGIIGRVKTRHPQMLISGIATVSQPSRLQRQERYRDLEVSSDGLRTVMAIYMKMK